MPKYTVNDLATLESILIKLEYQFVDNACFTDALQKFRAKGDVSDLVNAKCLSVDEMHQAGIKLSKNPNYYLKSSATLFQPPENKAHHPACLTDPDNYKITGESIFMQGIDKICVW